MKKILKTFFVILLVLAFAGSGGYLLYDQLTAQKEARDLIRLMELVSFPKNGDSAAGDQQGEGFARDSLVTLTQSSQNGLAPVAMPGFAQGGTDSNAAGDTTNGGSFQQPTDTIASGALAAGNSGYHNADIITARLTEFCQSYLAAKPSFANPAIKRLSLSFQGNGVGNRPVVRAGLSGAMIAPSAVSALENDVSEWFFDQNWHVEQQWDVEFDVQVRLSILPQFQALYEQNIDLVGWIQIEDTPVNYPVMQNKDDPEYYLHRNFEGEYAYSGLPFMDARNDAFGGWQNLVIYAHNMKNGTMFGLIPKYESKTYWQSHPVIALDLLTERREYEVFAAFRSRQYNEGEQGFRYYDYITLAEEALFGEFIRQAKEASYYDTGINPVWGDQLLTLSTCSYHTDKGSFVLVCRRVR